MLRTDTRPCVLRAKRRWDINFGIRVSGRRTYKANRTTFRPCTWSIWIGSVVVWSVINCVRSINNYRPIRIVWRISIKIYPITPNIKFPFTVFHKNGCGANRGVPMPRKLPRRRSICATTRCTKNPKFPWRNASSVDHSSTKVGSNWMPKWNDTNKNLRTFILLQTIVVCERNREERDSPHCHRL